MLLPTFHRPSVPSIREFLVRQARFPPTYAMAGTLADEPPPGYRAIRERVRLGRGAPAFDAARSALLGWEQFPPGWVELCFPDVPIEPGRVVAVLSRAWARGGSTPAGSSPSWTRTGPAPASGSPTLPSPGTS